MQFVKIGDSYFNPMRIDRIRAAASATGRKYRPMVQVFSQGGTFYFDGLELGLSAPDCEQQWEALGLADAMVAQVMKSVNEALK